MSQERIEDLIAGLESRLRELARCLLSPSLLSLALLLALDYFELVDEAVLRKLLREIERTRLDAGLDLIELQLRTTKVCRRGRAQDSGAIALGLVEEGVKSVPNISTAS